MRAILFVMTVLMLLFSIDAFAGERKCLERLTSNYQNSSVSFTLNIDELDPKYSVYCGNDHLRRGVLMIRALLDTQGCNKRDVNFRSLPHNQRPKSKCRFIIRDEEESLVCYIETNLGKFRIQWDSFENVFLLFSRWD